MIKKIETFIGILISIIIVIIGVYIKNYRIVLINKPFYIHLNETVTLNSKPKLKIKLNKASDSRCKKDRECIWEGELSYELIINDKKYQLGEINNTKIDVGKYKIKLIDSSKNSARQAYLKIYKGEK